MADRKKKGLAIIGCGGISKNHARGLLEETDRAECVALCDVSAENLATLSEMLGGVDAQYDDWKEMIEEAGDAIDAVVICLPHHLHAPCILDSVAAGKHILCEKPMCINLGEADRIVEAVRDAGLIYMSAHNQLFQPAVIEARRRIEAGDVGRVQWVRSQDCFVAGGNNPKPFDGSWRALLASQGGGELIDTGYHPTYRLLHLAGGKPVAVRGCMGRFRQAIEGDDTASVLVAFDNGALGEVFTSWAMPLPHGSHQIHVLGEKGQVFGTGDSLGFLPRGEREPQMQRFDKADTFVDQMHWFIDCLWGEREPIHGAEEGREVLQVILGATQDADGWQKHAHIAV